MEIIVDNLNWRKAPVMDITTNDGDKIKISAIIEDASDRLNFYEADKYLITRYNIKTGDIVEYNNLLYLTVSQIDRYAETKDETKHYNRARIRQMDHKIKMVINGKVEEIPSILEGRKFSIAEDIISLDDDKIVTTMQGNSITNEIEKNMRFIKLGQAWEITGIDKTKLGLIILYCDADVFGVHDDRENEIADTNLINSNGDDPEPEEGDYRIELNLSYNEVIFNTFETCSVKVYFDDVEVDDDITFEIIGDDTILWLENIQHRQCNVKAGNKAGKVILRVSLADDEDIYEEIEVSAVAW